MCVCYACMCVYLFKELQYRLVTSDFVLLIITLFCCHGNHPPPHPTFVSILAFFVPPSPSPSPSPSDSSSSSATSLYLEKCSTWRKFKNICSVQGPCDQYTITNSLHVTNGPNFQANGALLSALPPSCHSSTCEGM